MPNIFNISNSSSNNILNFIDTIDDIELRAVILNHWQDIISVGKLDSISEKSQSLRTVFFDELKTVIEKKLEGDNENFSNSD